MPSRTRSSAARYGIDIEGSSIYITTEPCSVCAKMLINAGIKEIVFATAYPDKLSEELLGETDILLFAALNTPNNARYSSAWALFTAAYEFFNF